jgi:hypothetical protein
MRGGSPLLLASAKAGHTSCIFERQVTKKADVQNLIASGTNVPIAEALLVEIANIILVSNTQGEGS